VGSEAIRAVAGKRNLKYGKIDEMNNIIYFERRFFWQDLDVSISCVSN